MPYLNTLLHEQIELQEHKTFHVLFVSPATETVANRMCVFGHSVSISYQ